MKLGSLIMGLILTTNILAQDKVESVFLGEYKLISSVEGECAETVVVAEREVSEYALWITYYSESQSFAGNEKFDKINAPLKSSNDTCMTAGPVNPFCFESRKEITKYDQETLTLENFAGKKTTFSNAKYNYTKLEALENGLKVTQLKMEKPMAHGVFTFTPVETGATSTAYYTFPSVKLNSVCIYDKQ